MVRAIAGWRLAGADRARLLEHFPPRYANPVADHVTLRFGTGVETPLPAAEHGVVVGEANDAAGVQALVVAIDGTTQRGDGSHFHITWSLAPGRKAKESNDVIARCGWEPVDPPIAVRLLPARWAG